MSYINEINQKALQLHQLIEKLNIDDATTNAKEFYSIAIKVFNDIDDKTVVSPLAGTKILLESLSNENIQCDDALKYRIAHVARILMDLTFTSCLRQGRNVYSETQKKMIELIDKVMGSLPPNQLSTKYELKCCFATALVLNSPTVYLKDFISDFAGGIVGAIASLFSKPETSGLIAPIKQLAIDSIRLIKTGWFNDVFPLHLRLRRALQALLSDNPDLDKFEKKFFPSIDVGDINKTKQVAFCILEIFIEAIESIKNSTNEKQLKLFKTLMLGGNIGLISFINLDGNGKHFWKVRYRALEYAFELLKNPSLDKDVKNKCISALVDKINSLKSKKDNKSISKLIFSNLKIWKNNPSYNNQYEDFKREIKKLNLTKQDVQEIEKKQQLSKTYRYDISNILIELTKERSKKTTDAASDQTISSNQMTSQTGFNKAKIDEPIREDKISTLMENLSDREGKLEDCESDLAYLNLIDFLSDL